MNQVHIILAAYNGEKYIKEQIESIIKSKFTNWKLWIFDDGSIDKTAFIVKEYQNSNPEKILFHKNETNKGVTFNFLEGVRFVAKEIGNYSNDSSVYKKEINNYFMFCDQDDVWNTDKIEKTLRHMKKVEKKHGNTIPVAVFTDALVVDDKLNTISSSFHKSNRLNITKTDLPHILMENKLIGCTVMFNEALQQRMSQIPKKVIRYHDWWVAMIGAGFGVISYLPETTLMYRQHNNNVVGNQNFVGYVKSRIQGIADQKSVIQKTILQAEEFYHLFHNELEPVNKMHVYTFANLYEYNPIQRRIKVIKHGFLKTGLIRNIGLLWVL